MIKIFYISQSMNHSNLSFEFVGGLILGSCLSLLYWLFACTLSLVPCTLCLVPLHKFFKHPIFLILPNVCGVKIPSIHCDIYPFLECLHERHCTAQIEQSIGTTEFIWNHSPCKH